METVIIVLLFIALGLNISASMTVEGSMLSKVNLGKLLFISIAISFMQAAILLLGNNLKAALEYSNVLPALSISWSILKIIVAFALFLMGVKAILKSFNKKYVEEKRQININDNRLLKYSMKKSINAFVVGIILSLLNIDLTQTLWILIIINVLSIIVGIYIGYWLGYEEKENCYRLSGIIYLIIAWQIII